jgi:hypothetical protein
MVSSRTRLAAPDTSLPTTSEFISYHTSIANIILIQIAGSSLMLPSRLVLRSPPASRSATTDRSHSPPATAPRAPLCSSSACLVPSTTCTARALVPSAFPFTSTWSRLVVVLPRSAMVSPRSPSLPVSPRSPMASPRPHLPAQSSPRSLTDSPKLELPAHLLPSSLRSPTASPKPVPPALSPLDPSFPRSPMASPRLVPPRLPSLDPLFLRSLTASPRPVPPAPADLSSPRSAMASPKLPSPLATPPAPVLPSSSLVPPTPTTPLSVPLPQVSSVSSPCYKHITLCDTVISGFPLHHHCAGWKGLGHVMKGIRGGFLCYTP